MWKHPLVILLHMAYDVLVELSPQQLGKFCLGCLFHCTGKEAA